MSLSQGYMQPNRGIIPHFTARRGQRGGLCQPNKQDNPYVLVVCWYTYHWHGLTTVYMCTDANAHTHTYTETKKSTEPKARRDFVLPTTKFWDGAWVTLADVQKVLMNGASKANNSNGVLFLSISQMLMFFWVDIKDPSLFCHLKGND